MRVLAVDPAVRNTGYAVVTGNAQQAQALDYGVIRIPASLTQSAALAETKMRLSQLIEHWQPDEAAVEGIIFVQSHQTAISMGAARAAVMIATAERGIALYEYAPRKIKMAVMGRGSATKEQVAFMVRALLKLQQTPVHDAADALAIALAHLQQSDPLRAAVLNRHLI